MRRDLRGAENSPCGRQDVGNSARIVGADAHVLPEDADSFRVDMREGRGNDDQPADRVLLAQIERSPHDADDAHPQMRSRRRADVGFALDEPIDLVGSLRVEVDGVADAETKSLCESFADHDLVGGVGVEASPGDDAVAVDDRSEGLVVGNAARVEVGRSCRQQRKRRERGQRANAGSVCELIDLLRSRLGRQLDVRGAAGQRESVPATSSSAGRPRSRSSRSHRRHR